MYRSLLLLVTVLIVSTICTDRPDIAATIPPAFTLKLKMRHPSEIETTQELSVDGTRNMAKSVQAIIREDGTQEEFITIADFNKQKTSVFSSDHDICYIDDIEGKLDFVNDIKAVFNDPTMSPMHEDSSNFIFTVNWKSLEGVDDWTHFYFNKQSKEISLFEHYFKTAQEDPWVVFDIMEPITKKTFKDSDFVNPDCKITEDEIAAEDM